MHILRDPHARILAVVCVLFIATIYIWSIVLLSASGERMTVAFLDVGQGDAIYVETPDNTQMLVDGGAGKTVLRELGEVMPFYDRSLDIVVATHPDKDHIGGLPHVLDRFDVSMVMRSGVKNDTVPYRTLNATINEQNIPLVSARRGMRVVLGEEVYFDVLFPDRSVRGFDANSASIVGRLTYGESEVLLTGDAPDEIEEYLTKANREVLTSDILKVGHHGSDTSTSQQFLAAVSPQTAIISAGKDNAYGHPDGSVVERIENFGADIISTQSSSTIVFESDGTQFHAVD